MADKEWKVRCMDCDHEFTHYGEPQKCPECGGKQVTGAEGSDLPNRVFTIYWEYSTNK